MGDLVVIQDWFNANKLTLNLTKTVYLYFEKSSKTNTDLDLTLNGVTIPRVNCTKFLDIWVDDQLNWKQHITKLVTKLSSRTCLLHRGRYLLSSHAKKIMYYGQIYYLIASKPHNLWIKYLGNVSKSPNDKSITKNTKPMLVMH